VQLTFAPGRVTVGAGTQGQARARESVPADFAGDEPSIAFSPHYLLDGVVAALATAGPAAAASGHAHGAEGGRVRLWFTSASKPAVITSQPDPDADDKQGEGDFRYLVVPQRVAR
jgi:DNA polymerase-3 subunit beta